VAGDKWGYDEIRKMELAAHAGMSMRQAAAELGRSPAAVAIKAAKMGISFHAKSGAPLGNRNSAKPHARNYAAR